MRGLLDDERLNGPHEVHVTFRPRRVAIPVASGAVNQAIATIETQCQIWGGATTPLIPLTTDGAATHDYAAILPGAAVDQVLGLNLYALGSGEPLHPEMPSGERGWWGSQFAAALLDYHRQDLYAVLEIVELSEDDPWRPIYAACLGRLPQAPTPGLLSASYLMPELTFDDFLRVERVEATGSLDDLLARLSADGRITPRQLSMVHLAYGNSGSTALREKSDILPTPGFDRYDAGPNVVVVCSPGSLDDLALLWNLRCAQGDGRVMPIGLPLADLNPEAVRTLVHHPRVARNGMAQRAAYLTSASIDAGVLTERLSSLLDDQNPVVAISPQSEMLDFGYPGGWHRDDVLVWHEGRAHLTPLSPDSHSDMFQRGSLNELTHVAFDIAVPSRPFPNADDVRVHSFNGTFAAGSRSSARQTARSRSDIQQVEWPSPSLIARAIARRRGFDLVESEPGRACRVLLAGMEDLSYVSLLAHAPLLDLLEQMAARHGFSWYKERLRSRDEEANPITAVPSATEDLPTKAFNDFKKVLGNNDRAAKHWLLWAEQAGMVIKGIPLRCVKCRAKQWIPVNAFTPPIICQGCGEAMDTPFGDRPTVNFTYRLSERLRRVYEHDAMGHLLVANYFDSLFRGGKSGRLVGLHPGMEVRDEDARSVIAEADVLMLTRHGEFIPVEVKRRAAGLTADEVQKLDTLTSTLAAPWSALAACQYSIETEFGVAALILRDEVDGTYRRMVLTYDRLLEPNPVWSMGSDPFDLAPLSPETIEQREQAFVDGLASRSDEEPESMFEYEMLHQIKP